MVSIQPSTTLPPEPVEPEAAAGSYLRCAGCGTAAVFGHRDRQYGRLVRDFLDQHGQCGNAVQISAARQHAGH